MYNENHERDAEKWNPTHVQKATYPEYMQAMQETLSVLLIKY